MQDTSILNPVQTLIQCIDDTLKVWFPRDTDGSCMRNIRVRMWPQTHGSTALGFPGVGGRALTEAMTVVLELCGGEPRYRVYHGGMYAYTVQQPTEYFTALMFRSRVPGKQEFERTLSLYEADLKKE